MNIRYYQPTGLTGLVHAIWEQRSEEPMQWQILPSGRVELIFNMDTKLYDFKAKELGSHFNPMEHFCFLSGLHTKPLSMSFPRFHVMGVQMDPSAVKAFFGIPTKEVLDWAILGEHIFPEVQEMEERLQSMKTFGARAEWLSKHLQTVIQDQPELHVAQKMQRTIAEMLAKPASCHNRSFEDFSGYSRSHTHRLFTDWLGLAPSQFLKLQQFRNAVTMIHLFPKTKLTDIAMRAGYYDQSHFIRHFRFYSGITPKVYRQNMSKLLGQLNSE